MSTWYDCDVICMGSRSALSNLINLPESNIFVERISLSFGQTNGPGVHLRDLIQKNPDLIFLINITVEGQTSYLSIEKYDLSTKDFQRILIERHDYNNIAYNKLLLQEYEQQYPELMRQHWHDNRRLEWDLFFYNFSFAANILNQHDKYQETVTLVSGDEIFDDEDYPDLEGK